MEVSCQLHARAALHHGSKGPTRCYGNEQHLLLLPATEPHVVQPIAYNCTEHTYFLIASHTRYKICGQSFAADAAYSYHLVLNR